MIGGQGFVLIPLLMFVPFVFAQVKNASVGVGDKSLLMISLAGIKCRLID